MRTTLLACLLAVAALGAAVDAQAQIFVATRPNPQFTITPMFVVADVASNVPDVPVEVIFSVMIPSASSALDHEQDTYLLWPGEVGGADSGKSGIALPPDVAAQITVIDEGHLVLRAHRQYESPQSETIDAKAPFISVVRTGGPLGLSPAATYIRIPWNQRLINRAWLVSVQFTAKGLLKPKATTWLTRIASGPRSQLALGLNEIDSPAMFAMYYWERDRVIAVQSPARLVMNFANADRLAIDAMFPPEARRERSPSLENTEIVSLFLSGSERLTPQVLRVEFGYLAGLQAWGPVLIPALFFMLGNIAGVLVRNFAERLWRRFAGRIQLGRRSASADDQETGTVISRDRLGSIVPGETTYEQVLERLGGEVEEREAFGGGRKTLVYRGRRDVPHRKWAWSWLATVSHWDVERHEVEITLENNVVQDIQVRVGRARAAQSPDVVR